jgi:hypothetical protein
MKRIYTKLISLVRDEGGTEVVEWAVAGGLIVAGGVLVFQTIGTDAGNALTVLDTNLDALPE